VHKPETCDKELNLEVRSTVMCYETEPFKIISIIREVITMYKSLADQPLRTRRVRESQLSRWLEQGPRRDPAPMFSRGGKEGCRSRGYSTCRSSHELHRQRSEAYN